MTNEMLEREAETVETKTNKTIILFSGEFDKVVAAFVIANGAAAMDDEVTMFFTFWSINALRRPEKVAISGKTALQKAFSVMMPRGQGRLNTSHMNFAGAGPKLMKRMMREQNVMSLEELIASAREQNIKMVVCQMSMDIMGLKAEELIDGLEFAGVASYLSDADDANVNLFI
ncbi:MAG TPA: DsrE/DsrF/DrsH-like family protein [Dermatophilaceae bacterium]|jgi:peroxiredoxin family protein